MARSEGPRRRVGVREQKPRILIVCEGEKTEPSYFKAFPLASLEVVGAGANTLSVVDRAIDERARGDFDQVRVVFDRDSFPAARVNAAVAKAERLGIRVAWTNEAFELWYLLHFAYVDSALGRAEYAPKLSARIGRSYGKNDPDAYDLLLAHQPAALRNAARLLASHPQLNPAKCNPATTVHLLVEELNRHKRR